MKNRYSYSIHVDMSLMKNNLLTKRFLNSYIHSLQHIAYRYFDTQFLKRSFFLKKQCNYSDLLIKTPSHLIVEQTLYNYWTRLSKISGFISGEHISYLPMPKAEENN